MKINKKPSSTTLQSSKPAAFFDFDGTLYDGVLGFDFLNYAIKNRALKLKQMAKLPKFLYYYAVDKFKLSDRYDINVKIYKRLKGWETLEATIRKFFEKKVSKKLIPEMIKILNEHKRNQHKAIIVTSALRETICPIMGFLDVDGIISTEVEINDGIYTGLIKTLPVGKARVSIIKDYCKRNNIDLLKSYGYSDHNSDIPLLKSVGNPVAINPERKLRRYAKRHGWKIIDC